MQTIILTDTANIGPALTAAPGATIIFIGSGDIAQAIAGTGSKVLHISNDSIPAEAFSSAVAQFIADHGAKKIIGVNTPAGRALATASAVATRSYFIPNVTQVEGDEFTRSVASIAEETLSVEGPVTVIVPTGVTEVSGQGTVEEIELAPISITDISVTPASTPEQDITTASRVVAAGRGFKAKEDLDLAETLAEKLGAVTACSRPLAEGVNWFPKSTYIGVSGHHLQPEIYVAIGISGQIQHIVGARDSETIIAINSDANAPIFKEADYGIIGDLYTVLPQLNGAL